MPPEAGGTSKAAGCGGQEDRRGTRAPVGGGPRCASRPAGLRPRLALHPAASANSSAHPS